MIPISQISSTPRGHASKPAGAFRCVLTGALVALLAGLHVLPRLAAAQTPDTTAAPDTAVAPDTLSATGPAAAADTSRADRAKAEARPVAEAWIDLIDQDAFAEAYDEMRGPVPDTMSREEWVDALHGAREYVDAPSKREEAIVQIRETLPEIQGGPFVDVLYEGEYELGTFSESVLLRREASGWRVVMYQIIAHMPVLREHEDVPFTLIKYPGESE